MLVLGDVMAVIAILIGFALSAWGGMMLSALFFPSKAREAAARIESRPFATFAWGLAYGLPLSLFGIALLSAPQPVAKVIGFVMLMIVVLVGMVGSGGVATIAAQRIEHLGGATTRFHGLARGGMLAVFACLMPIFGWFFLAPVMLILCVGAGFARVRREVAPGVAGEPA